MWLIDWVLSYFWAQRSHTRRLHRLLVLASTVKCRYNVVQYNTTLIARFMGPTWGPSGANRTQVGPMLAPWTLLSGNISYSTALTRAGYESKFKLTKKYLALMGKLWGVCCEDFEENWPHHNGIALYVNGVMIISTQVHSSSGRSISIQDPTFVITVAADVLAPISATTSPGKVPTKS